MRILFVCLGNICRSPILEAVARARFERAGVDWRVASCGTGGWHAGEGADSRAMRAGADRGYSLQAHRARELRREDYREFDLLLAADQSNLRDLRARAPENSVERVALALPHAGIVMPAEVPDPYYGSARDFEFVVDLAEQIAEGLLHKAAGQPMLGSKRGRGAVR